MSGEDNLQTKEESLISYWESYDPSQWGSCEVQYKTSGYWEPMNDGSGRIRIWTKDPNSNDTSNGSWSIDLPPNHPRRVLRMKLGTPFICPVCNGGMYDYQLDAKSYRMHGCCRWCLIDFVEGFEEDWKNGYRPTKEQIKERKDKRPKMK
jgi:hypothetical protein